jgi:hypothetical protein
MTDLGIVQRFLGINIHYSDENDVSAGVFISKKNCVDDLVTDFGLQSCRLTWTPLPPGRYYEKSNTNSDVDTTDRQLYRSIISRLNYLVSGTRPDIAYAISHLTQFNSNPTTSHLDWYITSDTLSQNYDLIRFKIQPSSMPR